MSLSLIQTVLPSILTGLFGLIAGIQVQRMANRKDKQKEIRSMMENIYRKALETNQLDNALHHPNEIDYMDLDRTEIAEGEERIQAAIDGNVQEMEILIYLYLHPLEKDFVAYKRAVQSAQNVEDATKKFCLAISEFFKKKGYSYF